MAHATKFTSNVLKFTVSVDGAFLKIKHGSPTLIGGNTIFLKSDQELPRALVDIYNIDTLFQCPRRGGPDEGGYGLS